MEQATNPTVCEAKDKRIEHLEHAVFGNAKDGLQMEVDRLKFWKTSEEKRAVRRQRKIDAAVIVLFAQTLAFVYWFLQSSPK